MDDATGLPIDPNTGMLVDPTTGQQIDPQSGMPAQQPGGDMPFTGDPEVLKTVDSVVKQNEKIDKSVTSLARNLNAVRTDIQGLRRETSETRENQDVVLSRIDNLLNVVEQLMQRVG